MSKHNHQILNLILILLIFLMSQYGPRDLNGQVDMVDPATGDVSPLQLIPGWRQATYDDFVDQPQLVNNHPMLLNLLNRVPSVAQFNLDKYTSRTNQKLAEEGDNFSWEQHRGQVFHLSGVVDRVVKIKLGDGVASRFEFDHFYIAHVRTNKQRFQVACRSVPKEWALVKDVLEEPVVFDGYFLRPLETDNALFSGDGSSVDDASGDNVLSSGNGERNSTTQMLFVSNSLQWYPEITNAKMNVLDEHLSLAAQHVDFGLRGKIDNLSVSPINSNEATLLMQLLTVASRKNTKRPRAYRDMTLIKWLKNPEREFGIQYRLEGKVTKVSVVEVELVELRRQFDIDRYYQLDMFVNAPEIKMLDENSKPIIDPDGKPFVYGNKYAISVLCQQLPKGIDMEGKLTADVDFGATIDAFFFKTWKQRTFRTRTVSPNMTKATPLLVGFTPEITPPSSSLSWPYLAGVIALGVLMFAFAVCFWWLGRRDAKVRESKNERILPDTIDVDF